MKAIGILLAGAVLATQAAAEFKAVDKDGRIEVRDGDKLVLGWQYGPLAEPKGGEKFAASAFLHPLTTPGGFGTTQIQPGDHLHHLGVWWPWKLLEVDGKKYVTWELQKGEGRHRAVGAKIVSQSADEVLLELENCHEVVVEGKYVPVVAEKTRLKLGRLGKDAYVIDLEIGHEAIGDHAPKVVAYRYSGFGWRGPEVWNKDNSKMLSSGGHNRDSANHQGARWVMVNGEAGDGDAALLLMSAASKDGGDEDLLRVWPTSSHNGAVFVNFNPVVKKTLPITDSQVAKRKYRLIAADRQISAEQADKLWQAWK